MKLNPCACGTMPIYSDVGGNNEEIEIYCPGCGRSILVANKDEAPSAWDKSCINCALSAVNRLMVYLKGVV